MKLRPVHCLREHAGLQSLELRPVHQPVNLDQGLAMEAALTALAWSSCTVGHVRGGPWCLKDLPGSDEAEIKQCVSAMKGKKSLATQSSALVDLAAGMSRSSSLVRHLKHECFKCGLHLSSCTCRSLGRRDSQLSMPNQRKSTPHAPGSRAGRANVSGKHKAGAARQSTKHKSGSVRKSGKHKAGAARQSTKHHSGAVRKSGKHKSGTARQSGKHKPGVQRASGSSGSQMSGSHRRFSKPPLPSRCR